MNTGPFLSTRSPLTIHGLSLYEISREDLHSQLRAKGYHIWKESKFKDVYQSKLADTLTVEYGYFGRVKRVSGDAFGLAIRQVDLATGDTVATIQKKLGKPDKIIAVRYGSVLTYGGGRLALIVDGKGLFRFAQSVNPLKLSEEI